MQTSPPPPASTARPLPGRAAWLRRWLTGAPAHAGEPLVGHRIDWLRAVPFLALHAGCLGVLWVGISPVAVAVATLLYVVRMFAITGFYHRYFSHRAFRTSRPLQALAAIVGASAVRLDGGPVPRHRHHHNAWLVLLTFGEGWHNNHHFYPGSARQGFRRARHAAGLGQIHPAPRLRAIEGRTGGLAMTPNHHPDASTLLAFSAGALPEAFAAVVAAHLDVCDECRGQLALADRIGGHLLVQQDGAPLPDDARERLRARVLAEGAPHPRPVAPPPASPTTTADDALPRTLQPYFGRRYSDLRWRMIGPGIHYVRADRVDDGHLMLLRTAPGRSVPMHTHGGSELTLILRGAYRDAIGHFAPGDVADLDSDVEHQPVTVPGVPCICVAATDAPLRFSGWMARMLQPLFKL